MITSLILIASLAADLPEAPTFTNDLGMSFVRIESGSFTMGADTDPLPEDLAGKPWRVHGDHDEHPGHEVTIPHPFYVGTYEVTNAEYEQFDPAHKSFRGKLGFSSADNEAVVFVSWHDAVAYCRWLTEKDGLPYRLPTEAEWEYACRAGTTTPFNTGVAPPPELLKNPVLSWYPDPARSADHPVISLAVGNAPANSWGIFDMHGNVEEWCLDWYGPYAPGPQRDPVGPAIGDFRVTRGGSHSTLPYYLRSANRSATLPEERTWVIGFRVVIGETSGTPFTDAPPPHEWQRNVRQDVPERTTVGDEPYFVGPRPYVKIPSGASGPMIDHHNHCPAITECANGDLLVIWYTCYEEPGRELGILASRLRRGHDQWDPAAPFWDAPDRNDHASALWFDGEHTLYHFNGLSVAATWGNLATILRTSTDNGVTWSSARLIVPEHGLRHMPIESVFQMTDGTLLLPCDAASRGDGGTAIHLSGDGGQTWTDPGGTIAGIHAGVVELANGRLMALGRGDTIDGRMPKSVSDDRGATWVRTASPFPPIAGGQRLVLTRLHEGPLFLASFAAEVPFTDAGGQARTGSGLFAALSFDDGETWPVRRLVTDDGPARTIETLDGQLVSMDRNTAEPRGYLSVCQAQDNVIHLISSRQHYAFNLAWLQTPPPPE